MANIFAPGVHELAQKSELNKLVVDDNTPQFANGEDLNNFFTGFKIANGIVLKNAPTSKQYYL